MKKVKEKKPIDYSKMPDDIWEKELREFSESMRQLEVDLGNLQRMMDYIEKQDEIRSLD